MDPSYSNGVGSSPIPQQQIPQQPMNSQQPISSGTGDIVLGGADSNKKSRKGIVILIILVAFLALIGGGILLWQNGVFGGSGSSQLQVANLEEKFNSYIDYVLYGEDSAEKYGIDEIEAWTPYFAGLEGDELSAYIEKANYKYLELENAYSQSNANDRVDITPMKIYYQDYASMQPMSEKEVSDFYIENGLGQTKKMINNKYIFSGNNLQFETYLESVNDSLSNYLTLLVKADKAGCIRDKKIVSGCYKLTEEEYKVYQEKELEMGKTGDVLKKSAVDTLKSVYNTLYGSNGNVENANV